MKNKRVLFSINGIGASPVIQSFDAYQVFSAELQSGSVARVIVEQSENGDADWLDLCEFELDTRGEVVSTDLMRVSALYVRARVAELAGNAPKVIVHMGL